MKLKDSNWVLIKGLIFVACFSFFHYFYDFFKFLHDISGFSTNIYLITGILGATNESVMSHMKIAFWGYFFTILIEYGIFRQSIDMEKDYFISRLLTISLIPWVEFIFWFIGPLFFENLGPAVVEVIYSIVIVYIMGIWTGFLEINIEINFKKVGKILVLIFFITSTVIFSGYSFVSPYIDVFYGIYQT